ncbi:DMT family transporter [Piscinibacter sp.]|uniref:DMT family transporter n=1 Tax=Piscinibacter sp. TaxID=1903157 RepID=UPI001DEE8ED3|nr:DMT family transporter [Piscinibacter sp.]MBK7531886.1 DMT family transporter [Piscinibacter sp.]MBL0092100.1 DMT family transporter [Piscinibacter sp.]HOY37597.1 DMT family transporter [Piscinibacter sp.]HPG79976.1 DMT family transporter [Piscinibacter sp.]
MTTSAAAERRLAHALIFIAPALWSVNYLVARWAPGVIAPHALALGRWGVAALVLALFCHREIAARRQFIRGEMLHFLVLGALGMWVCGAFVYIGGRSTAAVNIGLLYAASPVLIALFSAMWLRERFGVLQALGVALALAGVLHVLVRGQWDTLADVRLNPGDLWIAVAVVCWTAYSLLLRAWPSAFSPVARLTLVACGGIVVLLPFTLWEALFWLPSELSWRSAGLVLAAALIPGAAAYGAYSIMQRTLGAARVSVVLYLGPLYSALIGWAVLGERIEPFHALGALMILPGIWLSSRH